MQLPRSLRIVSAGMALSLVLVACSGDDETAPATSDGATTADTTDDTTAEPVEGAAATDGDTAGGPDSGAAALRATLTAGLQEHVYLAGIAVNEALTNGLDSQEFTLAAGALDANSKALAGAIDSVYEGAGEAFLPLWRNHIQFFVDYTAATAAGDEAAAQEARDGLDTYRADFGAFLSGANPNLPAEAVAEELVPHVETVFDAIDAIAGNGQDPFVALREAAAVMPGTAKVLAGGIAAQFPEQFDGAADGPGADLRATLTAGLQEHVYLAGIAVKTAYAAGPDSEAFTAATETLDTNSQELSTAVGSIAGEDKGQAFLELWRQHIGFFVDFAVGAAGGDEAAKATAIEDLAGYTQDAGAFFEEVTGGELPADAVAGSLEEHITTLAGAIESLSGVDFS